MKCWGTVPVRRFLRLIMDMNVFNYETIRLFFLQDGVIMQRYFKIIFRFVFWPQYQDACQTVSRIMKDYN